MAPNSSRLITHNAGHNKRDPYYYEAAIVRLVGAIQLEQNDEWAVSRRYMSLETLAGLCDDPVVTAKAITAA